MARTVLPIVGAVVGAYFGSPQIGYAIGAVIGNAVDPVKVRGPSLGETGAQTSAEGAPRAIIYGTISCTGNIIAAGPLVIVEQETQEGKGGGPVTTTEHGYRTYAIRICEGPVGGVLRIWEDDKLVYDKRSASTMLTESDKWLGTSRIYLGGEDQLPDPDLETSVNSDMPAYRGTAYMVFVGRDLTDRRGSIPQYRFEVAHELANGLVGDAITNTLNISPTSSGPGIYLGSSGEVGLSYFAGVIATSGGTYPVKSYDSTLTETSSGTVALDGVWNKDGIPITSASLQTPQDRYGIFMNAGTFGGCYLGYNGSQIGALKPNASFPDDWWSSTSGRNPENDGRRIWFSGSAVYIGTKTANSINVNNIGRWTLAGGFPSYATALLTSVTATPGDEFFMHYSRDDKLRVVADGELRTYSDMLVHESTVTIPFSLTGFHGFGCDDGVAVFVFSSPSTRLEVRPLSDLSTLTQTIVEGGFSQARNTRVVFTSNSLFVQTQTNNAVIPSTTSIYRIPYSVADGQGMILGDIVADIHDRCGIEPSRFDVSELIDVVDGLLLAGDYTGADAINTLRIPYFFDGYNADKKLWFPKRGADASFVIDLDDLVEDPDTSKREQAVEYPKKLHLQYQHGPSGYAVVKATSSRSSPDARVIGETALSVPVVLDENEAAQIAAKLHKVAWAEADGEIVLSLPDSFLQYTPTDVGSVTLRGTTTRRRITDIDYSDGVIKWTLKKDRQSAYTSDVEGVPVPMPTPPPATIVGPTILAVMDIPSRIDSEDDLNIYYSVTGAMPAWHGAMVQRSLDGGANYTNVIAIGSASRIGVLMANVADASEDYTDTTNTVTVSLYRDGQTLESISNTQFLSEGGAFCLQNSDGSWEILQYRDAVQDSSGDFTLSHLQRGRLNSGTQAHTAGALFVMLEDASHVVAQSAWIGEDLTHRAPSFEQSPEEAVEQTEEYVGRSQIEWPIAYLQLSRSGSNISATWTPRHRFGTEDNPVASINFQGYRVTIDGGSNGYVSFDTTTAGFTNYNASSLGGGLTVSVSALNRITGPGPSTSGII